MSNRILSQHFTKSVDKLLSFYKHSSLGNHPDVKDICREGFIKIFLKDNLPTSTDYYTGEIIDEADNRSGQVDIILQSNISPKINLFGDINIAFNDYVLDAIEVKSILNTATFKKKSSLKDALTLFTTIRKLKRNKIMRGKVHDVIVEFPMTPCFLFAYKGPKAETLLNKIKEFSTYSGLKYDEFCPEVIVILDKKYTVVKNDRWIYKRNSKDYYLHYEGDECLVDLYQYIFQLSEAWYRFPPKGMMNVGNFFKKLQ